MQIKKSISFRRFDSIKYMLSMLYSNLMYTMIGIAVISIIITIEGLIFGFTLAHNITYFFFSMIVPVLIYSTISIAIIAPIKYKKNKFPYKEFNITITADGYSVDCDNKTDNIMWSDAFSVIMIKRYMGIMPMYGKSMYEALLVIPTKDFTRDELMEIDTLLSTYDGLDKKYRKSKFFSLK